MTLPKLIAICGAAGSGKDTLAAAIPGAVRYSFALPLKQALNALFGWTMADWDDREWKEAVIPWLGKSPRQLAQTLGTEWGRDLIHPDLWILLFEQRYRAHIAAQEDFKRDPKGKACFMGPFVVADCRFDNEAIAVTRLGGTVVKVVRPGVAGVSAHVSEKGVSEALIDAFLINSTSKEKFQAEGLSLLERLALRSDTGTRGDSILVRGDVREVL